VQHQRRFDLDPPKRVLVFGSPGSGRTRVVAETAKKFSLPIVSIDRERAATANDPSAWRKRMVELAQGGAWIMMGNDLEALDGPLRRSDWLVLLNLPMTMCVIRVLRTAFSRSEADRPDVETGVWRAVREAWDFPTEVAPLVAQAIDRERRNRTIFILHSHGDVGRFLARLPDADGSQSGNERDGGVPTN
jgi:hypothetical protein